MSTPKPARHSTILGVRIDALTMDEAAATIIARASVASTPACYITKPYVEFLDQAAHNPELIRLLNNSWLSLPDAVSLQWATTFLHNPKRSWWHGLWLGAQIVTAPKRLTKYIPERFSGTVFTWRLLEACAHANTSIYLIGSPIAGSITHTAAAILKRLPALRLVGSWPGELGGLSGVELEQALADQSVERDLVRDLRAKQPDIVLVGMGFPLQEKLMAKLVPALDHGVLIGEGGTFDYDSFGGKRRKAPQFVQTIGLEWLWRLGLEPRRIKRQLAIPRFMWAVYRSGRQR